MRGILWPFMMRNAAFGKNEGGVSCCYGFGASVSKDYGHAARGLRSHDESLRDVGRF